MKFLSLRVDFISLNKLLSCYLHKVASSGTPERPAEGRYSIKMVIPKISITVYKSNKVSPPLFFKGIHSLVFFKNIYSFLAGASLLGLCSCMDFSLVVMSGGYSLAAQGLLIAEHRLWGTWASATRTRGLSNGGAWVLAHRCNSCGTGTWLLCCM